MSEYLASEENSRVKHEYVNGSVIAQAGATKGEKKEEYLRIASLATYVMLEQERLEAIVYQRVGNEFEQYVAGPEACIPLDEVNRW